VAAQLGREPLIPFTVVARCATGHPLVIRNRPVDDQGHPFPTLYWLTCPETVKAVSALESDGWIKRLEAEAEVDPDFRPASAEPMRRTLVSGACSNRAPSPGAGWEVRPEE